MNPQEFKYWIENCVIAAKNNGMTDDMILIEFMEQVKRMLVKKQIEILNRGEHYERKP